MAKFSAEQAVSVLAINQVINEWGDELDRNDGLSIRGANVLTEDCRYFVGGEWRDGLDAAAQFYADRKARLQAAGGAPVMRHLITNLKVTFDSASSAKAEFLLLFFAHVGEPPFVGYSDPLAVADVHMECRCGDDGDWLISRFESEQIFQRG